MRGAHGIATHLLQDSNAECLHAIGQRRAHSGVILVIARALNLHGLSVQEEAMVRIELHGPHSERYALGIANLISGLDSHDRRVEIRVAIDHNAAWSIVAVAVNVPVPSTATCWAGASAAATVLPVESRICQLTEAAPASLPSFTTMELSESVAEAPFDSARTEFSDLPR